MKITKLGRVKTSIKEDLIQITTTKGKIINIIESENDEEYTRDGRDKGTDIDIITEPNVAMHVHIIGRNGISLRIKDRK